MTLRQNGLFSLLSVQSGPTHRPSVYCCEVSVIRKFFLALWMLVVYAFCQSITLPGTRTGQLTKNVSKLTFRTSH